MEEKAKHSYVTMIKNVEGDIELLRTEIRSVISAGMTTVLKPMPWLLFPEVSPPAAGIDPAVNHLFRHDHRREDAGDPREALRGRRQVAHRCIIPPPPSLRLRCSGPDLTPPSSSGRGCLTGVSAAEMGKLDDGADSKLGGGQGSKREKSSKSEKKSKKGGGGGGGDAGGGGALSKADIKGMNPKQVIRPRLLRTP